MDRCICGSNRPSGIPRPGRSQGESTIQTSEVPSRSRIPCPYPGSRIPLRVPPYTGEPLYLPPTPGSGAPQWPGMRPNFSQEVRDFQYDPNFFDENRPMMQSRMLITGRGGGRKMQLERSNRPDMAVNQPILERPPRPRGFAGPVQKTPVCHTPRQQMRTPARPETSQMSWARPSPRAISTGPTRQRPTTATTPPVQPVRSTGAIPKIPGIAPRVPSKSPQTPSVPRRQPRPCRAASPQPVGFSSPPPQMPTAATPPHYNEYMGEFELMEKIAEQEYDLGVQDVQPAEICPYYCPDESFDEFEQLEKTYEKVCAPSDRVPYMSPESLREFEELEKETHLQAVAAPQNLEKLLEMPPTQLDVQPLPQQGSEGQSDLRKFFMRQREKNRAAIQALSDWERTYYGKSDFFRSPPNSKFCPPECKGL
nr:extensin-like [Leptinotarsa decemlineata]